MKRLWVWIVRAHLNRAIRQEEEAQEAAFLLARKHGARVRELTNRRRALPTREGSTL